MRGFSEAQAEGREDSQMGTGLQGDPAGTQTRGQDLHDPGGTQRLCHGASCHPEPRTVQVFDKILP